MEKERKIKTVFMSGLIDIKNKEEILKNCVTSADLNDENYGHYEVIKDKE